MVAHAGFEPAISTLRGWCPRPLDECATLGRNHLHRAGGSTPGYGTIIIARWQDPADGSLELRSCMASVVKKRRRKIRRHKFRKRLRRMRHKNK